MKALQVIQPRSFSMVQIPEPHLETNLPGQIKVRTSWVSMCGSDIPYFSGGKRFKTHPRFEKYPLDWGMPIHECVGQVVESTSERFQPDDWVVAIPDNDQGLAEFFTAQASKAVRVPDSIENKAECCLIQPLSTVMNAVDRLGDIEGKSVAVIGLGSIGLFFCWLLRKRGAGKLIGIDPIASRCRAAKKLGADQAISKRSIEVVHLSRQKSTSWNHPENCIEAVGHQMDTLNDCIELVQNEGTVLAFGVPDQPVYAIEFETFFRKNAVLMAVVTPDWQDYLERSRDLFLKYRVELTPLITHRFSIQEAGKAFQMYNNHEDGILKAIIDATQW
jgi:threonine dehydrogenase-like Zn-dependent dehydrogenase